MNNYDNNWYQRSENPENGKIRTRSFWQRHRWVIIGIIGVLLAVVFASTTFYLLLTRPSVAPSITTGAIVAPGTPTDISPTQNPAATTAPTMVTTQAPPVASGAILCHYDTTQGFSGWINSPQWKQINDGTLGSDGTDNGQGSSTYMAWSGCNALSTANYAVEAQIQYVRSTSNHGYFEFGIMLHGDGNASGYEVGVDQDGCNGPSVALISLVQDDKWTSNPQCYYGGPVPLSGSGSSQNYPINMSLHTYHAEITGNTIRLFIDGKKLLETSDNTITSAGQVGLISTYGDINVKSFKVIAL